MERPKKRLSLSIMFFMMGGIGIHENIDMPVKNDGFGMIFLYRSAGVSSHDLKILCMIEHMADFFQLYFSIAFGHGNHIFSISEQPALF